MQSLRIYAGHDGVAKHEALLLPFFHADPPLDAEIFRRLARGEAIPGVAARLFPSGGLRAMRSIGEQTQYWNSAEGPHLIFVVSGQIEISADNTDPRVLTPGDVLLVDRPPGKGLAIKRQGDCRLLQLDLPDPWAPQGRLAKSDEDGPGAPDREPNLKRMYKAGNGKSFFRGFDELFPDTSGKPSPARPVRGFWFVSFAPGAFIDWHPEVVNNFVVVLSGELELEVSGDGSVEVFAAGDVCLAQDRTGEGHIDRMRGLNRLLLVELEDADLW